MKNSIKRSALLILVAIALLNVSFPLPASQGEREASAKTPMYNLNIQNLNYTSSNVLEFDIYLHHTNSNETKFEYIMGQYFLNFNSAIANGGKLNYTLVSSELPQALQPRNASVFENQLRLANNAVPPKQNLPIISNNGNGTLIAKMKLETTAKSFSSVSLDLKFRNEPENPYTKIFTNIENKIVDITSNPGSSDELIEGVNKNLSEIPVSYSLSQNFPNPFNPSTTFKFDVPELSNVKLTIYDVTGKEVITILNQEMQPGSYDSKWDASNFASGIYFYRINAGSPREAGSFIETKRMLLVK